MGGDRTPERKEPALTLAHLRRVLRAGRIRRAFAADSRDASRRRAARSCGGHPFGRPVLDIRPAECFLAGHLPGTVCIPADEIDARIYELPPKERALIVAGDDPAAAAATARRLHERGWLACLALGEPLSAWPGPWETGAARARLWEPSPLVRRFAPLMPAGPVADLGCGAGRDAVYLALRGHPVVAVDRLPEALEMARALAARNGAAVHAVRADLRRERPPDAGGFPAGDEAACAQSRPAGARPPAARASSGSAGYSAVLMIRFLERDLRAWIAGSLAPGGLFLLEAHLARGLPPRARPSRTRLRPQEARALFALPECELRFYEETRDEAGEAIARLVLRRPTQPLPEAGFEEGSHGSA